jgi:hypothetical protein
MRHLRHTPRRRRRVLVDPLSPDPAKDAQVPRTPAEKRRAANARAAHYLRRIHALFTNDDWNVRYMRIENEPSVTNAHGLPSSCVGFVDDHGGHMLCIDFRHDVLATVVHEAMHVLYPQLSEKTIIRLEEFVMHHMSPVQARRLHHLVADHLT